jgi:hypothetical protein
VCVGFFFFKERKKRHANECIDYVQQVFMTLGHYSSRPSNQQTADICNDISSVKDNKTLSHGT